MQERKIDIAVGHHANAKKWRNKSISWDDFVEQLKTSVTTGETIKEYLASSKEDQGKIKDVGGYVGGYLVGGKRLKNSVGHRQLVTLDIDFAEEDFFFDFEMIYSCCAFLHSTHKHRPGSPRYRLLIPLDREVSTDEYSAISRKIAGNIGIDIFDPTTFDVNRLMFWPSNPKDIEYYWQYQEGEFISADEVLNEYIDWKDTSLWPRAKVEDKDVRSDVDVQEDPAFKKGVVGAFCRTYGIDEAITKFLPDIYTLEDTGRYTYSGGSTSSGVVTYDNVWSYSHHGTDPTSGRLCNAFDLVRIHLYGHLDKDSKGTQSFKRMEELCTQDKEVKYTIAVEKTGKNKQDAEDVEWMTLLDVDAKSNFLSTANNLNLILANDENLKELFKYNVFDSKRYILRSAPWREVEEAEPMRNVDYAGVRNYIETTYGISSSNKIEDSLSLEIERNSFHPIKDYLLESKWDGVSRIGSVLPAYFGAEDTVYTREAFKKMLVASVARIMEPGCKFDYALILVGTQGLKKSSFLNILGRGWFSDSFNTVQGKESFEQLQGAWIIEIAELSAFRKSEVESIKHFIAKQKDDFRPAYARSPETFKRQCVFFGTTNNLEFLKDPTGNRRFWPVLCGVNNVTKDVFKDLPKEIDQIWAEAFELYICGETLFLSKEVEEQARVLQELHSEKDERLGVVLEYLDRLLPEDWDSKDIYDRRQWLENPENRGTEIRDYVCTAEVWCECLGKNREDMSRYNTREVNDILRGLPGWQSKISTMKFKMYGKQKYYERIFH
jgi:putative DNA primase/helicase